MEWLHQNGDSVSRDGFPPIGLSAAALNSIVILVHGYNSPATNIANYFEELVPYLRDNLRQDALIIVFDWYSDIPFGVVPNAKLQRGMYWAAKSNARVGGAEGFNALVDHLTQHLGARKINVIAHSMGCYLVLEALKKRAPTASPFHNLVFLAPLVTRKALADPKAIPILSAIDAIHIYYSEIDPVFSFPAYDELMLGNGAPAASDKLPQNVKLLDATTLLAKIPSMHGEYLRKSGAEAISLYQALK